MYTEALEFGCRQKEQQQLLLQMVIAAALATPGDEDATLTLTRWADSPLSGRHAVKRRKMGAQRTYLHFADDLCSHNLGCGHTRGCDVCELKGGKDGEFAVDLFYVAEDGTTCVWRLQCNGQHRGILVEVSLRCSKYIVGVASVGGLDQRLR